MSNKRASDRQPGKTPVGPIGEADLRLASELLWSFNRAVGDGPRWRSCALPSTARPGSTKAWTSSTGSRMILTISILVGGGWLPQPPQQLSGTTKCSPWESTASRPSGSSKSRRSWIRVMSQPVALRASPSNRGAARRPGAAFDAPVPAQSHRAGQPYRAAHRREPSRPGCLRHQGIRRDPADRQMAA